jgi:MOSC domain-containing protein YiiM
MGTVTAIFITSSATTPMASVASATLEAGRGIVGDRYHAGVGTWSETGSSGDGRRHVTLIEAESIAAVAHDYGVALEPSATRRNIVTRDVALNHLVGAEFFLGAVRLRGVKLCEPCNHLQRVSGLQIRAALVHRAGLNCEVLTTGIVRVSDPVVIPDTAAPAGAA